MCNFLRSKVDRHQLGRLNFRLRQLWVLLADIVYFACEVSSECRFQLYCRILLKLLKTRHILDPNREILHLDQRPLDIFDLPPHEASHEQHKSHDDDHLHRIEQHIHQSHLRTSHIVAHYVDVTALANVNCENLSLNWDLNTCQIVVCLSIVQHSRVRKFQDRVSRNIAVFVQLRFSEIKFTTALAFAVDFELSRQLGKLTDSAILVRLKRTNLARVRPRSFALSLLFSPNAKIRHGIYNTADWAIDRQ